MAPATKAKRDAYAAAYRVAHRDRMKEYHRQYYLAHRETMNAQARALHKLQPPSTEAQRIKRKARKRELLASAPPCIVDGCDHQRGHAESGLCSMHRARQRSTGSVGPAGALHQPPGSGTINAGYHIVKHEGTRQAEHRAVMEVVLGRALAPGETVHHVNGVRSDNRAENLELWSKNHGYGQRVSDQVAWALRVLKGYAPHRLVEDDGLYLQMASGRMVDLLSVEAGDIEIADIAHALAMTCRFNGHTRTFHSVAHHSLLVASLCPPEFALEALLHDASEAITGDCPTPIKRRPEMAGFRSVEDHISRVIRRKFGLPQAESAEVKAADRMALAWERRDLMQPHPSVPVVAGLPAVVLQTMTPAAAEREFLAAFRILASRRTQTTHSTATVRTAWECGDQRIGALEEERVALEALVDRLREAMGSRDQRITQLEHTEAHVWSQQERIARLRTVVAMMAKHFPHTQRFRAALDSLEPGDLDG